MSWKTRAASFWVKLHCMCFSYGIIAVLCPTGFCPNPTTPDVLYFHKISTERFWDSLTEIKLKENPVGSLAVFVWNRLYMLNITLGLDHGPWVGILFNGLLVGLSAGLTIQIARYVFGSDARRLTLLGNLCASCGMFWLFGAIHLRGSFTLFVNTLLLYGFVRFLALPQMFNGILLSIILFLQHYLFSISAKQVSP